ncbi:hypothetical protein [Candidatus Nitrospira bockiana]
MRTRGRVAADGVRGAPEGKGAKRNDLEEQGADRRTAPAGKHVCLA